MICVQAIKGWGVDDLAQITGQSPMNRSTLLTTSELVLTCCGLLFVSVFCRSWLCGISEHGFCHLGVSKHQSKCMVRTFLILGKIEKQKVHFPALVFHLFDFSHEFRQGHSSQLLEWLINNDWSLICHSMATCWPFIGHNWSLLQRHWRQSPKVSNKKVLFTVE